MFITARVHVEGMESELGPSDDEQGEVSTLVGKQDRERERRRGREEKRVTKCYANISPHFSFLLFCFLHRVIATCQTHLTVSFCFLLTLSFSCSLVSETMIYSISVQCKLLWIFPPFFVSFFPLLLLHNIVSSTKQRHKSKVDYL